MGCEEKEKDRFWNELNDIAENLPEDETMVIGADLNSYADKVTNRCRSDRKVWHQRTKLGRTENNRLSKKDEVSCNKHLFPKRRVASNL